ncbi:hypothetical protein MTR67_039247 [Solanum verrucosum]|uniref:Uncharacterized protein n=1 Tax=Solanum verrucosum TaxID=315347 RepID=A0AAF0UGV6_SOLVR|nr:hypothetical protein MTR67_039247 [Solanum verrucosum]
MTFHPQTDGLSFKYCMAPFEALYGRSFWSPIDWFGISEVDLIGPKLVQEAMEKV